MLIGLVSVLCVLSVPLFGGNLRRLADLRLRGGGFLIAALAAADPVHRGHPGRAGAAARDRRTSSPTG